MTPSLNPKTWNILESKSTRIFYDNLILNKTNRKLKQLPAFVKEHWDQAGGCSRISNSKFTNASSFQYAQMLCRPGLKESATRKMKINFVWSTTTPPVQSFDVNAQPKARQFLKCQMAKERYQTFQEHHLTKEERQAKKTERTKQKEQFKV